MALPPQPSSNALSRRERQIMDAIYAAGEANAATVLVALPDPPGYSTVRTLLRILEDKGHLKHRNDGSKFVYAPTRTRSRAGRWPLAPAWCRRFLIIPPPRPWRPCWTWPTRGCPPRN